MFVGYRDSIFFCCRFLGCAQLPEREPRSIGANSARFGCKNRLRDVFEIPYSALLERGVKFYATLGNHDEDCAAEQIAYPLFNMNGKRYYTFKPAGDLVEFFAIDTTLVVNGKAPNNSIG
jgi:hypothetical protein